MTNPKDPQQALQRIIDVMAKLRDPESGCPWDLQQTWHSLIAYTLEEAYEVADAIESSDQQALVGELGDLLFQVVFYSRIAEEQNLFDLQDVIHRLCDKLEQRHPHVFADANYSEEQLEQAWHKAKAEERENKKQYSALDDIPLALPALVRAQKLQRRASNEGFDWRNHQGVLDKIDEEVLELKQALVNNDEAEIQDELGDLLFTVVNLARHLKLDAETCLRQASTKFEKRFRAVEQHYQQKQQKISDTSDVDLAATWEKIK
ncbi:MAG: nucleoside triphosphate pyrophosphohydrolase [Gammaproteobacteria bacterium]|nr:MAG: nucleoside triphosphate pyrophosphohydrolase [Gammaproteobacteria bacterium]